MSIKQNSKNAMRVSQVEKRRTGQQSAVPEPRERIKQAARDVRSGLIDTDRRRLPDDVPGPRIDPERTPGAEVPHGMDRNRKSRR